MGGRLFRRVELCARPRVYRRCQLRETHCPTPFTFKEISCASLSYAAASAPTATSFAASVVPAEAGRHAVQHAMQWRGPDGRMLYRRNDDTIGLVVGGVAGALVGRSIDTRGDRTAGTVVSAGAGALLGRAVTRKTTCR